MDVITHTYMQPTGLEFLEEIYECHTSTLSIKDKYPKLRTILERAAKALTMDLTIQFPDLYSRLNYLCDTRKLNKKRTYLINTMRIHANKVLHDDYQPDEDEYLLDIKSLSLTIGHFYQVQVPFKLQKFFPSGDLVRHQNGSNAKLAKLRIIVSEISGGFIWGMADEIPTEDPLRIRYNVEKINDAFADTIRLLKKGSLINIVDFRVEEDNTYVPDMIILEPDYLVDISSIAECIKEYSVHPYNYFINKLNIKENTTPILLGNMANCFLDAFVNARSEDEFTYNSLMKEIFRQMPFELSTNTDLDTPDERKKFFENSKQQYNNIRRVVLDTFPKNNIDKTGSILEPSFICEQLGIQGRLDFLSIGGKGRPTTVIELKSGRAPYPDQDHRLIGDNHRAQLFLYQIVIQRVLGLKFKNINSYLLYSRYTEESANLRKVIPFMEGIKAILNVRNQIVAIEKSIAEEEHVAQNLVNRITPATLLNKGGQNEKFLRNYIIPQIEQFKAPFLKSSALELSYFYSLFSFVSREHYISKAGDAAYDSSKGHSALWNASVTEKLESGEILTGLKITDNAADQDIPVIRLKIPEYEESFLSNFRQGDIVILYEKNKITDNVTNKQIFRGTIISLSHQEISIRIRYRQSHKDVLSEDNYYAVEHDFLDSSYNSMYRGLYSFLMANQDRKDLLLHQRQPETLPSVRLNGRYLSPKIDEIVLKAKQAKDYFLLVGPPGTGKTSVALKSIVEEYYTDPSCNILLLSYTNRAVDEICEALSTISTAPDFVRIGSEFSCDPKYHHRLLNNLLAPFSSREEVKNAILSHRIFVATVAAISGKSELLKLKQFDVAIIDEASQILEPHLLGTLTAKTASGTNAIQKFILIGDHKQLPAIVLQSPFNSRVQDDALHAIGLFDRKDSFFERLFNLHKHDPASPHWSMLYRQGRMHPDIALFPNYAFYNNQLQAVPTRHQLTPLEFEKYDHDSPIETLIATQRLAFIPSERNESDKSNKINSYEANIIVKLISTIYDLYLKNNLKFIPAESVGIITPYRSQIALIKKGLHELQNPELMQITVDTVERYQGSQRDFIIYSFCVNQYSQLDFLSNTISEQDRIIDRKLNVAITRAKKQFFVTGNAELLYNNIIYYQFIEFIRSKGGYIKSMPDKFLDNKFKINNINYSNKVSDEQFTQHEGFERTFDLIIRKTLQNYEDTELPHRIVGFPADYVQLDVVKFGRTDLNQDKPHGLTSQQVSNIYCYFSMQQDFYSTLSIFRTTADFLNNAFQNTDNRIMLIDFGCGPMTAGLAFSQVFDISPDFHFDYVGIDISRDILDLAEKFSHTNLLNINTQITLCTSFSEIDDDYWKSTFKAPNTVVLDFSHVFGNIDNEQAIAIAGDISTLQRRYPLNKYILIVQNTSIEKDSRSYLSFKTSIRGFKKIQKEVYHAYFYTNFDGEIRKDYEFFEVFVNE